MSERLNWDDTRIFLAIARTGSLTGAASQLGGGIATMSRRIDRLENSLGIPLFVRHQSGYRLTDEGESLLPRAEALEDAALSLGAKASAEAEAAGRVRLATAENLANPILIPALPALIRKHPLLSVEIVTNVSSVNLHRRDADIAIRMVRPVRGNVTMRRIGTLGFGLYGSPDHLASRKSAPDSLDLEHDQFVAWSEGQSALPAAQWIERALRGRSPVLTTTTLAGQVSAASAGIGLAILPHFLAIEAGLSPVRIELGIDQPIWLVIHSDLAASRRVRVVADHVRETVQAQHDRLRLGRNPSGTIPASDKEPAPDQVRP